MDRDTTVTLGISFLAIVALGTAAATLESAVPSGGGEGGGGFGSGPVDGSGSGSGPSPLLPGDFAGEVSPFCFPILREPLVVAGIGLLFAGLFTYIYRDTDDVFSAFVVCGVAAIPTGIAWTVLAFCGDPIGSATGGGDLGFSGSTEPTNDTQFPLFGGGSGEASGTAVSAPTIAILLLLGIALLGGLAVLLASRGDDGNAEIDLPESPTTTEGDVTAIARAAGRAADRIAADVPIDNEVFRAWGAMTEALDIESPETTTPAAFERAAVDAGMDTDDVAELRRVFEEVRYGGETPSEERERRAISALRRIEGTYGDLNSNPEDH